MALGWCQRMQMIRDVSVGPGEDAYLVKPEDTADLVERLVFAAVAAALSPHDPAAARVMQIRRLTPSAPRW